MIKTGIIGATGYAGQQLVSLLINHPEAEVTFVSSNSYAGQSFSDIYPQFYRILDQKLLSTEEAKAAIGDVDVVFTALPNGLVFEIAEIAMEKGTKIVDFSADFRLDDPAVYEEWYKTKHTAPQLVSRQVYGLPELWRDRIRNAQLVANPGCYTTASILAVSALLREEGLADKKHIIIDAKSGITGSGRKANVSLLYAEAGELSLIHILPAERKNQRRYRGRTGLDEPVKRCGKMRKFACRFPVFFLSDCGYITQRRCLLFLQEVIFGRLCRNGPFFGDFCGKMCIRDSYIVARGRKGGSTVAAAICNALLYMAEEDM